MSCMRMTDQRTGFRGRVIPAQAGRRGGQGSQRSTAQQLRVAVRFRTETHRVGLEGWEGGWGICVAFRCAAGSISICSGRVRRGARPIVSSLEGHSRGSQATVGPVLPSHNTVFTAVRLLRGVIIALCHARSVRLVLWLGGSSVLASRCDSQSVCRADSGAASSARARAQTM